MHFAIYTTTALNWASCVFVTNLYDEWFFFPVCLLFLAYGLDLRHQIASGFILADATTFCWSVKQKQVVLNMSEGNVINRTWISTSVNITTDGTVDCCCLYCLPLVKITTTKKTVSWRQPIRSGVILSMPIKDCVGPNVCLCTFGLG